VSVKIKGDVRKLRNLAKRLRGLPKVVAQRVARRVGADLSIETLRAYHGGRSVYGDARPAGENGALTLIKSGKTLASLRFQAVGTRVRASFGTAYARFLIGKYRILPMGELPAAWSKAIRERSQKVIAGELGGGS
jgi:hypothetical protein